MSIFNTKVVHDKKGLEDAMESVKAGNGVAITPDVAKAILMIGNAIAGTAHEQFGEDKDEGLRFIGYSFLDLCHSLIGMLESIPDEDGDDGEYYEPSPEFKDVMYR